MPDDHAGPRPAPFADPTIQLPLAMLAELTHRCPLQCPYCSNPLELERAKAEMTTDQWRDVIDQAAALGVLQIHLSGGEPTARKDLPEIVAHAAKAGLYTNLITAGVLSTESDVATLYEAGLDHVQLSLQDADAANADRIGACKDGFSKKMAFAGWVRAAGLPLTVNAVVHRQNLDNLPAMLDLALALGAARLEVAHVQYYGWALANREALMPTRAQLEAANALVAEKRVALKGRLAIDYVAPDYYAKRPKKCMDGWASRFFNVTPSGRVLPCHAAETITGLRFDSLKDRSLRWIWEHSEAMNRYRGTGWMPEPCRSCDRREIDLGGCRCQAFALTGDAAATDPACALSPRHAEMFALAETAAASAPPDFVYRRIGAAPVRTNRVR